MSDKQFINQLEADLKHIILAYPVYGQHPYYDMIGKVYNKVKEHNSKKPTTFFADAGNGKCIHCDHYSGTHKYSTKRCPK